MKDQIDFQQEFPVAARLVATQRIVGKKYPIGSWLIFFRVFAQVVAVGFICCLHYFTSPLIGIAMLLLLFVNASWRAACLHAKERSAKASRHAVEGIISTIRLPASCFQPVHYSKLGLGGSQHSAVGFATRFGLITLLSAGLTVIATNAAFDAASVQCLWDFHEEDYWAWPSGSWEIASKEIYVREITRDMLWYDWYYSWNDTKKEMMESVVEEIVEEGRTTGRWPSYNELQRLYDIYLPSYYPYQWDDLTSPEVTNCMASPPPGWISKKTNVWTWCLCHYEVHWTLASQCSLSLSLRGCESSSSESMKRVASLNVLLGGALFVLGVFVVLLDLCITRLWAMLCCRSPSSKHGDAELVQEIEVMSQQADVLGSRGTFARILIHKDFALYILDLATDAYSVINLAMVGHWFFALSQLLIIVLSIVELLRKLGARDVWQAYRQSVRHGFKTDDFLRIVTAEKLVEGPLSFMLQAYSCLFMGLDGVILLSLVSSMLAISSGCYQHFHLALDLKKEGETPLPPVLDTVLGKMCGKVTETE